MNTLSPDQLVVSQSDLVAMVQEVRNYFDNIQAAQEDIKQRLSRINEEHERSQRKARRETAKKSLRCFLNEPAEQSDGSLSALQLCTKSGAMVRLDALTFTVAAQQQEITTVNAAKRLGQQKHDCKAYYNLYYIRDGYRSAGFGWDRPFLDELFLA